MAHDLIFPDYEKRIVHALRSIYDKNNHVVLLTNDALLKFGVNEDVDQAYETIMTLPGVELHETYVTSDLITHVSSANAGDTEDITIVGLTLSGNDFTRVSQTVTLVGQTKTALSTPLARVDRAFNNSTTTDLVGAVYIYEDGTVTAGVPDTDSEVHCMIPAGENQTFKAAGTTASDEYYLVTQMQASVSKKVSASVDARMELRSYPGVFRPLVQSSAATTGSSSLGVELNPVAIIPPNTDYRMIGTASVNDVGVSAWLNGYFGIVQS